MEEGFSLRMELGGEAAGVKVEPGFVLRLSVQLTCGCNRLDRLHTDRRFLKSLET